MQSRVTGARFSDQIAQMITFLRVKMNECAEILMKSLHEDAAAGRIRMAATQRVLHQALVERLKQDKAIRADVWDAAFTMESFADFVLSHLVLLLQQKETDAAAFLTIMERILY
jgi:hypothetical protein